VLDEPDLSHYRLSRTSGRVRKAASTEVVRSIARVPGHVHLVPIVSQKSAVVMDVSLPGRGGIDAIRQIRQWDPAARLLVFTMHLSATFALRAFRAGAKGFVTKSSPPELLVNAVRDVAAGRVAICPEISEALARSRLQEDARVIDTLSPREFEILRELLDGRSAEEIAAAFNLSPKTVSNYHYAIKSKLGVSSDVELVHFGLRSGLITVVERREH
jgi:two-component system invasion response regulator UvrY